VGGASSCQQSRPARTPALSGGAPSQEQEQQQQQQQQKEQEQEQEEEPDEFKREKCAMKRHAAPAARSGAPSTLQVRARGRVPA